MTYAFWEGSADWYNGEHTPTGIRAHQSNDLTDGHGQRRAARHRDAGQRAEQRQERAGARARIASGRSTSRTTTRCCSRRVATGTRWAACTRWPTSATTVAWSCSRYDPEEVTTYELGWTRPRCSRVALRLSATAFYSDYTDMQNTGEKVVGVDEDPDSPNFRRAGAGMDDRQPDELRDQGPRIRVRRDSVDRWPAVRLSRLARHVDQGSGQLSGRLCLRRARSSTVSRSAATRRWPTSAATSCRSRRSTR